MLAKIIENANIAFIFVKKYWQLFFLIIGSLIAYIFFLKQDETFTNRLNELNKIHEEEIRKIELARQEEQQKIIAANKLFEERLASIQEQYVQAQKELDNKQKKIITQLLQDSKQDPNLLAKKLAEVAGFEIVLNTQKDPNFDPNLGY